MTRCKNSELQLVLRAGGLYFLAVFTTGFVLGPIRVLWAVPRFGTTVAELMEAPIMLVAIVLAARWIVRFFEAPPAPSILLGTGLLALGLTLAMEFTVVLRLRGLSLSEYIAGREPLSWRVYILMLGLFAVMPLMLPGDEARAWKQGCPWKGRREDV